MAVLYITEFSNGTVAPLLGDVTLDYPIPAPMTPPVAEQNVPFTGTSVQSDPFNDATTFIMVNTDAACSLAFGADPTAVVTAQRLAANETRFYGVTPGELVAVIANS